MKADIKEKLALLQVEILWLHDSENFNGIADVAKSIFILLGYNEDLSTIVGKNISQAYLLADKAEQANNNNLQDELKYYTEAKLLLLNVERTLNYPKSIAEFQINWWRYFRHKRVFKVILNIYYQHRVSKGFLGFILSVRMTYYLIKVGIGHNKRNKSYSIENSKKYWALLNSMNLQGFPYLG